MAAAGGKTKRDLAASGTLDKNPGRYRDKRDGKSPKDPPLGEPPGHLDFAQAHCWNQFRTEMPWLTASDATLVEMACTLRAQLMCGILSVKDYGALRALIVQLSGTTLSRDRMRAPSEDEDAGGS